jgi:hypothetical protein
MVLGRGIGLIKIEARDIFRVAKSNIKVPRVP